jgi:hypothetical protein
MEPRHALGLAGRWSSSGWCRRRANLQVAGKQFWLGPTRSGVTVTYWADTDVIHLLIAGTRLKSLRPHLTVNDLARCSPRPSEKRSFSAEATQHQQDSSPDRVDSTFAGAAWAECHPAEDAARTHGFTVPLRKRTVVANAVAAAHRAAGAQCWRRRTLDLGFRICRRSGSLAR